MSESVSITVKCMKCGRALDTSIKGERSGDLTIEVDPCEDCLLADYERGAEENQ